MAVVLYGCDPGIRHGVTDVLLLGVASFVMPALLALPSAPWYSA